MKTMKRLEHTYLVTGPYSDLYFGAMKTKPEIGHFDVKERTAVLLGDGEGPVSFTAMAEYAFFPGLSLYVKTVLMVAFTTV